MCHSSKKVSGTWPPSAKAPREHDIQPPVNIAARTVALSLAGVAVGAIAFSAWQTSHYRKGFAGIGRGDPEAVVLEAMGPPGVIELRGTPYLRYATGPCSTRCQRRLWWEVTLLHDIEAWSVELDADNTVVETEHWISP